MARKGGNPAFKTRLNPAILQQEGPEPAIATFAIKIPPSLKDRLKEIPKRKIRAALEALAETV